MDTRRVMLLYTLVSVLILLTPVSAIIDPSPFHLTNITYLPSAVQQGAVCLDGSPPAYHFEKGEGDGAQNWLMYLEGGGWCDTSGNCLNRSSINFYGLGSSKYMPTTIRFSGILSNQKLVNPYFYNWNRVYVKYCDGASFTGDTVDPVNKLQYRGAKIFEFVVREFLAMGMSNASYAVLAGSSAGGIASILNCDKFRSLVPPKTNVKCVSDGGYFIHVKDVLQEYKFADYFDRIVKLHGSVEHLPKSCTSQMKPESLCFYPQYAVPAIQTPIFIINSAYDPSQINLDFAPNINSTLPEPWRRCKKDMRTCSPDQMETLKGFRREFLNALPKGDGSFRGMFINSCLVHCQANDNLFWNMDPSIRLANKAIAEALGSWIISNSSFQSISENDVPEVCPKLVIH